MRFTIQTLNAAPRLKGFVLDILSNLVNKQVLVLCPHCALLLAVLWRLSSSPVIALNGMEQRLPESVMQAGLP